MRPIKLNDKITIIDFIVRYHSENGVYQAFTLIERKDEDGKIIGSKVYSGLWDYQPSTDDLVNYLSRHLDVKNKI
jgi:hypothetical protein